MAVSGSLQLPMPLGICRNHGRSKRFRLQNLKTQESLCILSGNLPSISLEQYSRSSKFSKRIHRSVCTIPCKNHRLRCHCFLKSLPHLDSNSAKNATLTLARSLNCLQGSPLVIKLTSAAAIIIFAVWGLGPLMRLSRNILLQKSECSWKKSSVYQFTTSYIQPLLLWTGAIFICRALDPLTISTEAGQIVKHRLLNFVRSLSTVLGFAYCLSRDRNDPTDTRNMGFQFAGKAVYTAVWVAAVSLFMELLGFSTQKWLTAGGLGTVLLTLAGCEIFTNFLSSAMIHATRPFVVNEWIQTKIEGYEVAISHLDVSKINNIVADMRKVLAKNPQVEQQKLHRRVFLDNINAENQALMILVSCFVKTSHFEEYLCVKEAILLDLLRVIRHHRARLATPIRTIQKVFTDGDLDSVPFSDSVFSRAVSNRPLLLIEPSYKINSEDKTKNQSAQSTRPNGEEDSSTIGKPVPDSKADAKGERVLTFDSKKATEMQATDTKVDSDKEDLKTASKSSPNPKLNSSTTTTPKIGSKPVEETGLTADNSSKKPLKEVPDSIKVSSSSSHSKQNVRQPATKPSLEENIVLGVALNGSKRILPIEEETGLTSNPEDIKELATMRSSGGPAVAESKSNGPGSSSNDMSDQQH